MRDLRQLGEFGLIAKMAGMVGAPAAEVIKSIGDDCAIIDVSGPRKLLITTDAILEARHFNLEWMSPFEAAQRGMAGAISDIAAMGGEPFASLCTTAIPSATDAEIALELLRGLAETGRRYGAPVIGGDTVGGADRIMVDIVVLGWVEEPWLRSGALPGDVLAVTGRLGESAAGLNLLLHSPQLINEPEFSALRTRIMDPTPRVAEARALSPAGIVHAAVDISDGLHQDAGHVARESQVRLEIDGRRIPVHRACQDAERCLPAGTAWSAATSGEEYELLLALSPDDLPRAAQLLEERDLAPLTQIGRVVEGEGVALLREDGSEVEMSSGGWDHFRADK